MQLIWSTLFTSLFILNGFGQCTYGVGASIHRYDQVLSFKLQKPIGTASIGLDLGLGVERSLQGALAPQLAVYGQSSVSKKDRHYPCNRPFFAYRLQIDMQHASMTNVNYALYLGLGYPIGKAQRFDIQLGLGGVYEKMYGVISPSIGKLPFFLNPQAQLNFHFFNAKQ